MKIMWLLIFLIIFVQLLNAQPLRVLNSCYYKSSDIIYSNSAAVGLRNLIIFKSDYQSLYSNIEGIWSYDLGFAYPLTQMTCLGLSGNIVSTGLLTSDQYSIFASHQLINKYLWIGTQLNLLQRYYNTFKIGEGFDYNDPVLDNTTTYAVSVD